VAALSFGCGAAPWARAGALGATLLWIALMALSGVPEGTWVPITYSLAGPWYAGRVVLTRRRLTRALDQRTRELEAERDAYARLAVRHERARVARELHDIVAHHLSIIAVTAAAGRMGAPAEAGERFAGIAEAGERALAEMARLVQVLGDEPGDHRAQLERLLDQATAAGLNVRATPLPREVELPHEVGATAHRVVQEGVTNALKHAAGADLHVLLAVRDGSLEVRVRDSGGRALPALRGTGAGLGLTGLRERTAAIGGRLDAAPAPGGGWQLRAELPMG
jgi:signal transduction histidine kinase